MRQDNIAFSILPSNISNSGPLPTALQFDTVAPTPSAYIDGGKASTGTSPAKPTATCQKDSDCASDKTCSQGVCVGLNEAAPLGPAGGSDVPPTSQMSTGVAIAVGLSVVAAIILMSILTFFLRRRRSRQGFERSIEAPSPNRTRSASSATDQKTLVASVPSSPRNARFQGQHDEMSPAGFAKLYGGKEKYAHERQDSSSSAMGTPAETEKELPMPPTDMPLPPPPTEEKRYAINVNINKSMIFDDFTSFAAPNTPRDSDMSRERMPKYRFEEYLPPMARTPRISVGPKAQPNKRSSEYESTLR